MDITTEFGGGLAKTEREERGRKNRRAAARNLPPLSLGNEYTERILAVKGTWLEIFSRSGRISPATAWRP